MKIYHSNGTHVSPTKPERLVKIEEGNSEILAHRNPKLGQKNVIIKHKTQHPKQENKHKAIVTKKLK